MLIFQRATHLVMFGGLAIGSLAVGKARCGIELSKSSPVNGFEHPALPIVWLNGRGVSLQVLELPVFQLPVVTGTARQTALVLGMTGPFPAAAHQVKKGILFAVDADLHQVEQFP